MLSREEAVSFRSRWQAVEAVERRERRTATVETRWRQLNALAALGYGLGLAVSDEDEAKVHARWAALREIGRHPTA
jgi:hypothetical protein